MVERCSYNSDAYESPNFLASSFKALDWDIDNQQGYAEAYKDVIHETQSGLARPQKVLITASELAELEAIHHLQGGDVVVILVPLVDHERSRNSSPDGSK